MSFKVGDKVVRKVGFGGESVVKAIFQRYYGGQNEYLLSEPFENLYTDEELALAAPPKYRLVLETTEPDAIRAISNATVVSCDKV